jgi:hypothetical protein
MSPWPIIFVLKTTDYNLLISGLVESVKQQIKCCMDEELGLNSWQGQIYLSFTSSRLAPGLFPCR